MWYDFQFFDISIREFLGFDLIGENPMEIGQLVPKIQAYIIDGFTNNKKQRNLSALFGCILKTIFASSDSFSSSYLHISAPLEVH